MDVSHATFVNSLPSISIVVSTKNSWASSITVPELRTLWDAAAEKKIYDSPGQADAENPDNIVVVEHWAVSIPH